MAKIKADLHNHFSTLENFGEIFDKAILTAKTNLGFGGFFAVVNAQDKGPGRYETFLRQGGRRVEDFGNGFYVQEQELYVLKGQEVFTAGGHLLVLGLDHGVRLQDYMSLEYSLKEARDHNGIIIADHPWFLDGIFKKGNDNINTLPKLDGIEVHNGESWLPIPGVIGANKKAQEIYIQIREDYDIGAMSFSDGHSVREIGTSYTVLEQPDFSSPEKLNETLRKSIREHKDWSGDKQTNSIRGTLDHSVKVAGLRIASKLGIIGRIN